MLRRPAPLTQRELAELWRRYALINADQRRRRLRALMEGPISIPADAILNELGEPLLNEAGEFIRDG